MTTKKILPIITSLFIFIAMTPAVTKDIKQEKSTYPLCYEETWGYVMVGREHEFSENFPITDVGYFVDTINVYSKSLTVPPKEKHFAGYKGRVHVVSSVDSKAQTHLLLDPELPLRNKIIDGLIKNAETYDGLQIDWELVPADDADNFYDFLFEIKKRLGKKMLTLAIPARVKTLQKDAYNYSRLSKVADKILIMAYDQHWSTSKPGPIASPDWCKRICEYAKSQIPEKKLIMGLPFYSRQWIDEKSSFAIYNKNTPKYMDEANITTEDIHTDENGNKYYTYSKNVNVTTYFDDIESCINRMMVYSELKVKKIGFWRIGQEETDIWKYITLINQ